jgi:hypothetical protein
MDLNFFKNGRQMNHAGRLISQVFLSFSICLAVLFLVLGNILAV